MLQNWICISQQYRVQYARFRCIVRLVFRLDKDQTRMADLPTLPPKHHTTNYSHILPLKLHILPLKQDVTHLLTAYPPTKFSESLVILLIAHSLANSLTQGPYGMSQLWKTVLHKSQNCKVIYVTFNTQINEIKSKDTMDTLFISSQFHHLQIQILQVQTLYKHSKV